VAIAMHYNLRRRDVALVVRGFRLRGLLIHPFIKFQQIGQCSEWLLF